MHRQRAHRLGRVRPLVAGVALTSLAAGACTSILGDFSVGTGVEASDASPACTTCGPTSDGGMQLTDAAVSVDSLTLSPTAVSLARGDMVQVAVELGNVVPSPVDVYLVSPPAGVTADPLRIPAGTQSGTLTLHVATAALAAVDSLLVAASIAGRTLPDAGLVDAGHVDSGDAGRAADGGDAGDGAAADGGDAASPHDGGGVTDAGPAVPELPAGSATAVFTLTVEGTNGGIDLSFGTMGTLVVHVSGGSDVPSGIAFDSEGRALIVGTQGTPEGAVIVRLTDAGALDTSFGSAGFARIAALAESKGGALAVGAGDALFLGGTTTSTGTPSTMVAGFTSAGQLDTSFASGRGYVVIDSGGATDTVRGIASVGGTLVVGGSRAVGGTVQGLLAGFTAVGAFANETTSGTGTTRPVGGFAADGTTALWLPALSSSGGGVFDTLSLGRSGSDSASFDATFAAGTGNFVSSVFSGSNFSGDARAAVQSTGRVIVAGTPVAGSTALLGVTAAGAIDPTFGTAGIAATTAGTAADIATDSADRIVVAGAGGTSAQLLRFTASGVLDATFADELPVAQTFSPSALTRVAIDGQGRILVVGHGQMIPGDDDWLIARFLP